MTVTSSTDQIMSIGKCKDCFTQGLFLRNDWLVNYTSIHLCWQELKYTCSEQSLVLRCLCLTVNRYSPSRTHKISAQTKSACKMTACEQQQIRCCVQLHNCDCWVTWGNWGSLWISVWYCTVFHWVSTKW